MRTFLILLVATYFIYPAFTQDSISNTIKVRKSPVVEKVYIWVYQMPEFPGGDEALLSYLRSCPYPKSGLCAEGKVYVKFIIDEKGLLTNLQIARGIHKDFDAVAIDCIKNMPRWIPGKQNGKPVKVQFVVPLKFKL